jgi:hypothetical protein
MSKRHGPREQKRLAKQKAKRKARHRQLARQDSPDPTIRLKAADDWPVTAALVPENLWTTGIGNLIIARRMPDGRLACALLLLDVFCLGVKDACWKIVTAGELNEIRKHVEEHGRLQDVPPEYFAKLVYRAADYGQALGFPPHRDFRHAQRLLAGIDPSQCPDEFEFGQDGRPHYIRGPSESMERARAIAERVDALGGHYTLPLGPSELSDFDDIDDDFDVDEFEDDEFADDPSDADDRADETPRPWSWLPWRRRT